LVTLDTSVLFTIMDRRAPRHNELVELIKSERGPLVIPVGIMAEITYFLEERIGRQYLDGLLMDIEDGAYRLDCGESDLPRIRALIRRYHDLPLGYADASVIACAERYGGTVATLDLRHFAAVAREGTIQIVP